MQQDPPSTSIIGHIVMEWHDFGHHFQIEKLPVPRRVGAGDRPYRLWDNYQPAPGGQWHYSLRSAVDRAEYVLLSYKSHRIAWLEGKVNELQRDLARLQVDPIDMLANAKRVWEDRANGGCHGMDDSKGGRVWLDGEFQLDELEALCIVLRDYAGPRAQGLGELLEIWKGMEDEPED